MEKLGSLPQLKISILCCVFNILHPGFTALYRGFILECCFSIFDCLLIFGKSLRKTTIPLFVFGCNIHDVDTIGQHCEHCQCHPPSHFIIGLIPNFSAGPSRAKGKEWGRLNCVELSCIAGDNKQSGKSG